MTNIAEDHSLYPGFTPQDAAHTHAWQQWIFDYILSLEETGAPITKVEHYGIVWYGIPSMAVVAALDRFTEILQGNHLIPFWIQDSFWDKQAPVRQSWNLIPGKPFGRYPTQGLADNEMHHNGHPRLMMRKIRPGEAIKTYEGTYGDYAYMVMEVAYERALAAWKDRLRTDSTWVHPFMTPGFTVRPDDGTATRRDCAGEVPKRRRVEAIIDATGTPRIGLIAADHTGPTNGNARPRMYARRPRTFGAIVPAVPNHSVVTQDSISVDIDDYNYYNDSHDDPEDEEATEPDDDSTEPGDISPQAPIKEEPSDDDDDSYAVRILF